MAAYSPPERGDAEPPDSETSECRYCRGSCRLWQPLPGLRPPTLSQLPIPGQVVGHLYPQPRPGWPSYSRQVESDSYVRPVDSYIRLVSSPSYTERFREWRKQHQEAYESIELSWNGEIVPRRPGVSPGQRKRDARAAGNTSLLGGSGGRDVQGHLLYYNPWSSALDALLDELDERRLRTGNLFVFKYYDDLKPRYSLRRGRFFAVTPIADRAAKVLETSDTGNWSPHRFAGDALPYPSSSRNPATGDTLSAFGAVLAPQITPHKKRRVTLEGASAGGVQIRLSLLARLRQLQGWEEIIIQANDLASNSTPFLQQYGEPGAPQSPDEELRPSQGAVHLTSIAELRLHLLKSHHRPQGILRSRVQSRSLLRRPLNYRVHHSSGSCIYFEVSRRSLRSQSTVCAPPPSCLWPLSQRSGMRSHSQPRYQEVSLVSAYRRQRGCHHDFRLRQSHRRASPAARRSAVIPRSGQQP
ncbi:hypothetical protein B0T14DRAFT_236441 [Immersiella caudata]|uniref:Uncharacterized protein n=1 Tax=Immersiella caudata TaxID=314043 RepID=A0AA40C0Z4_9PEZI|nr:hypothetical protein B0T14DRAFT_236441 [Immersiella caudata]